MSLAEDLATEAFTEAQARDRRDRVRIGTMLMLGTLEQLSGLDRQDVGAGEYYTTESFLSQIDGVA